MGSKSSRRSIFGTILAFAAIIATAGSATPWVAAMVPWLSGAAIVYSGVVAAYEMRLAKKQAADALLASLEDRKTMTRGGMVPKNYVYGRAWISGNIVFVREAVSKDDPYFYLVLALPVAHEIHEVESVWFGQEHVGPLDSGGYPQAGRFRRVINESSSITGVIPPGNRVTVTGLAGREREDILVNKDSVTVTIKRNAPFSLTDSLQGAVAYHPPTKYNPITGRVEDIDTYNPPAAHIIIPSVGSDDYRRQIGAATSSATDFPTWDKGDEGGGAGTAPVPNYTGDDGWGQPRFNPRTGELETAADYTPNGIYSGLVPGTKNVLFIAGNPGEVYTAYYTYSFVKYDFRVWIYGGNLTDLPHSELIEATRRVPMKPQWTENSLLRGIPHLILRITVDPDAFPNDLENISCVIKGKRVLDTRDGVTRWTQNSIMIARDYAIEQCGIAPSEFNVMRLNMQANVCDEAIPLKRILETGGFGGAKTGNNFHPNYTDADPHDIRYTANIVLSTEVEPIENLGLLLSTCDGTAVYSGSSLDLRCGFYEEPTVVIDDSDFAGAPEITVTPPRSEVFNGVVVRHVNEMKMFWPLEDATAYVSTYYKKQDFGVETIRSIDLPGTISIYTAQRLQKQMLHRSRNPLRVRGLLKVTGIGLSPEMTVWLNIKSLGMIETPGQLGKPMRIKSLRPTAPHTVEIEMQEDGPSLYAWDYEEGVWPDPTPNTTLPSIREVQEIRGLGAETSLFVGAFQPGGAVSARCRVYWEPLYDVLVLASGSVQVRHKRAQDIAWTNSPKLPPETNEYYFPCVRNDVLNIEVRAANSLVNGQWKPILKVANDAPTPYLSGNLVRNADMVWEKYRTAGPFYGYRLLEWNYGSDVPNYISLSAATMITPLDPSDASGRAWWSEQTGYMRIPHDTYVKSSRLTVTPGDRLVCFAMLYAYNVPIRMKMEFYTANNVLITGMTGVGRPLLDGSLDAQGDPTKFLTETPGFDNMLKISYFDFVPANANYALFVVHTQLPRYDTGKLGWGWFGRPYISKASSGQVQLPPWAP